MLKYANTQGVTITSNYGDLSVSLYEPAISEQGSETVESGAVTSLKCENYLVALSAFAALSAFPAFAAFSPLGILLDFAALPALAPLADFDDFAVIAS